MNQIAEKKDCPKNQEEPPKFVIGVRPHGNEQTLRYNPGDLSFRVGTPVMVETDQGPRLGVVSSNKIPNFGKDASQSVHKVLRIAEPQDHINHEKITNVEKKSRQVCRDKIDQLNLPMNLSRVSFLQDINKTVFYFTAEGRIDFRELVKQLAQNLRTRIEMRQVGVRDEAKVITGYGVCGEQLCCSTFLQGFSPVTIRMAKDQGLALNPSKISGVCGRLMCCLQYEHQNYKGLVKNLPKVGHRIETPDGPGRVTKNHILQQMIQVQLDDESVASYHLDDLKDYFKPQKREQVPDSKKKSTDTK